MQQVINTLDRLRKTNSSKEKEAILREDISDLHKQVFHYTYNHFQKYGVTFVDEDSISYSASHSDDWELVLFRILDLLSRRFLTGNAAREALEKHMASTTKEIASIVPMILKKDLRAGINVSLINKVYKDLLPEALCMAANKYDAKRISYPVWADTKLDGVRCIAYVSGNSVTLMSRNGREFKNYSAIEEEIVALNLPDGTVLDGEITMGHFQDLMRTISRKEDGVELSQDAVYNIFDMPAQDKTLKYRLYDMSLLPIGDKAHLRLVTGNIFDNEEQLLEFYASQLDDGQEGIMVKNLDGLYEYRRAWGWQKMKPEHTDDLKIIGYEEGRGKYEGKLGAIICELENGETVHVGSGFEDEEREKYWQDKEKLIGHVAEVKYQEKTRDGSLRFPIFIRFRQDKI